MADLDPKVVRRLRADHRLGSLGEECWGCAGAWPCDVSLLLASWERRGEALRWIAEEYADMGAGMTARASLEEGKP